MNKHTPGPWVHEGSFVYALNLEGSNRFHLSVQQGWATQGRLRTDPSELEANALVIAAAPELLEALQMYRAVVGNTGYALSRESAAELYAKASEVIAKATGEQR